MTPKVLIIGAGAIGGFYGALLAKAGADVAVVCRSDYAKVKQHGLAIHSATLGDWRFMPSQVLANADDYQASADYILLCTKVIPSIDRAALLRQAAGKNTKLVFIQNGVDIEQELLIAFPNHEIISGLAFICCNRLTPSEINHLAYGKLILGNLPHGINHSAENLSKLISQSGIPCHTSVNIIAERWKKCIWNAPFNPLSVLSGGLSTQAILQNQETLVRAIMQEVKDIAAGCGYPLPDNLIDQNIADTYAMLPYKTSMLLDFENGHVMETEAILGNTVRAARRSNIKCPRLETLYGLMKLLELSLKTPSKTLLD
jgi:2-dehydropantoate 2-reductase